MTENHPIRIYVTKIETRVTFEILAGYYREHLTLGTKELLGSTYNKIAKVKNGQNVPHLEIPVVVVFHCKYRQKLISTKFKSLVYHLVSF